MCERIEQRRLQTLRVHYAHTSSSFLRLRAGARAWLAKVCGPPEATCDRSTWLALPPLSLLACTHPELRADFSDCVRTSLSLESASRDNEGILSEASIIS